MSLAKFLWSKADPLVIARVVMKIVVTVVVLLGVYRETGPWTTLGIAFALVAMPWRTFLMHYKQDLKRRG